MLCVLLFVVINEFGLLGCCGVSLVGIGCLVILWVVVNICLLEKLVEEFRLKVLLLFFVVKYFKVKICVLVKLIICI